MALIAIKPCRFGDHDFKIGDVIPDELVINPKKQAEYGVIAIAAADEGLNSSSSSKASNSPSMKVSDKTLISIPVVSEKGNMEVSVSISAVKKAFSILQMNANDAKAAVEKVTDDDVLILLNAADKRKGVAPAIVARHDEITKE